MPADIRDQILGARGGKGCYQAARQLRLLHRRRHPPAVWRKHRARAVEPVSCSPSSGGTAFVLKREDQQGLGEASSSPHQQGFRVRRPRPRNVGCAWLWLGDAFGGCRSVRALPEDGRALHDPTGTRHADRPASRSESGSSPRTSAGEGRWCRPMRRSRCSLLVRHRFHTPAAYHLVKYAGLHTAVAAA